MKQFIKDGKIYNSPVTIVINGRRITSNSDSYLAKFGYEPYIAQAPEEPKKSVAELIEESDNNINKETDEKIQNGFTFAENEFYLTQENQINFGNMFAAREFIEYPQTIKTKDGYFELNNSDDVTAFYLSGVQYVKECLEEGWTKKEAAKQEILDDEK